ncbi:TPA: DUF1572 family protein [Candidatus Bathyarchaeota archaeon]|nr:DUF1572 family protein [Candidatus Bathyarchaeota archaeon]
MGGRSASSSPPWSLNHGKGSGELFIERTKAECSALKRTVEKALEQVNDQEFFKKPGVESHSIAALVKHVGGTLRSRFTNFLTEEGEKPDRDRENEFNIFEGETRAVLMEKWEDGGGRFFATLDGLKGEDLTRDVQVRWRKQPALEGGSSSRCTPPSTAAR